MKSSHSDLQRDNLVYSLATIPTFPPPARISEPPRTLLVVDDEPVISSAPGGMRPFITARAASPSSAGTTVIPRSSTALMVMRTISGDGRVFHLRASASASWIRLTALNGVGFVIYSQEGVYLRGYIFLPDGKIRDPAFS